MPGENWTFTTHVDPGSPPSKTHEIAYVAGVFMVEAPGTAPGSVTLIPSSVYHHS
jgi:hypothetical protein